MQRTTHVLSMTIDDTMERIARVELKIREIDERRRSAAEMYHSLGVTRRGLEELVDEMRATNQRLTAHLRDVHGRRGAAA